MLDMMRSRLIVCTQDWMRYTNGDLGPGPPPGLVTTHIRKIEQHLGRLSESKNICRVVKM